MWEPLRLKAIRREKRRANKVEVFRQEKGGWCAVLVQGSCATLGGRRNRRLSFRTRYGIGPLPLVAQNDLVGLLVGRECVAADSEGAESRYCVELLRNGDIYCMAPSTLRSNYRT